ncbi:MAG TPA: hypothetical protein VH307_06260 [Streptosporangiaceae bacterium]|nr:hypothetical protein [Streptosporangiaceae bacterium]
MAGPWPSWHPAFLPARSVPGLGLLRDRTATGRVLPPMSALSPI